MKYIEALRNILVGFISLMLACRLLFYFSLLVAWLASTRAEGSCATRFAPLLDRLDIELLAVEKLLDSGCHHVFLDIGSNIGVHVRMLFEPELYSGASYLAIFDKNFGADVEFRRQNVCAIGIEMNRVHTDRLRQLQHCYHSLGWRTFFFTGRAADTSDLRTYHPKLGADAAMNFWGFSLTRQDRESPAVHSIDYARFVETFVVNRKRVVPHPSGTEPRILGKIDIEGSEYSVLPSMLLHRNFCHINELTYEAHPHLVDYQLRVMFDTTISLAKAGFGCSDCEMTRTEFTSLDDETYVLDGKPLPCKNDII